MPVQPHPSPNYFYQTVVYDSIPFNTTGILWAGCPNPTWNGYDAYSVFADADGVHGWAFEYNAAGWSRFTLSTSPQSIIGAAFGTAGSTYNFNVSYNGDVIFLQDDIGNYYLVCSTGYLYKFTFILGVGALGVGEVLQGRYASTTYNSSTSATLSLSSLTGSTSIVNMLYFKNSGNRYIAFVSHSGWMWVINADTMTTVGSYQATSGDTGVSLFIDSSNTVWGMFRSGSTLDNYLINWNPSSGVSGSTLVTTSQSIPQTLHGMRSYATACCYVASTNSILLTSQITDTGDACVISMSSWTQTVSFTNDLKFTFNGRLSSTIAGFNQGTASNLLMIEGSPGTEEQRGGILRIIDPTTLTEILNYDVTSDLYSTRGSDYNPIFFGAWGLVPNSPQYGIISSIGETSGYSVSISAINNISEGSTLTFSNLTGSASFLNSTSVIQSLSADPNTITGQDTSHHGAFGPSSQTGLPVATCTANGVSRI